MLEDDSEAISGTKRRSHVMACGESTDHTRDAHTHVHKTKTKPKFRSKQEAYSMQHNPLAFRMLPHHSKLLKVRVYI